MAPALTDLLLYSLLAVPMVGTAVALGLQLGEHLRGQREPLRAESRGLDALAVRAVRSAPGARDLDAQLRELHAALMARRARLDGARECRVGADLDDAGFFREAA